MQQIRRSKDRGQVDLGWLHSQHSFSFGSYHDPQFMGWGNLRVINEDRVQPGKGFGTHSHRDMEIVSYVLSGELAHKDNMGNASVMAPGDVQRMSAGTGVTHSEYNHSAAETTHFLQIWLLPDQEGIEPGYEQVQVQAQHKRGHLHLIVSPQGAEQSVRVFANAKLYAGLFDGAESASLILDPARKGYVHVVSGEINVNGHTLFSGDALMLSQESALELKDGRQAEVLVFDLKA